LENRSRLAFSLGGKYQSAEIHEPNHFFQLIHFTFFCCFATLSPSAEPFKILLFICAKHAGMFF